MWPGTCHVQKIRRDLKNDRHRHQPQAPSAPNGASLSHKTQLMETTKYTPGLESRVPTENKHEQQNASQHLEVECRSQTHSCSTMVKITGQNSSTDTQATSHNHALKQESGKGPGRAWQPAPALGKGAHGPRHGLVLPQTHHSDNTPSGGWSPGHKPDSGPQQSLLASFQELSPATLLSCTG